MSGGIYTSAKKREDSPKQPETPLKDLVKKAETILEPQLEDGIVQQIQGLLGSLRKRQSSLVEIQDGLRKMEVANAELDQLEYDILVLLKLKMQKVQ